MVYQYNVPEEHSGKNVRVKDLWNGFRDDTSAHGIPHVSNAPGKFKKIFWLVISLGACGVLIFHLYTVITTFLTFSTTVKVSLLQEHETDFPAVTVCNLNPIKRSALYLDSVLEELLTDDYLKRKRKRSTTYDSPNRKLKRSTTDNSFNGNRFVAVESHKWNGESAEETDDLKRKREGFPADDNLTLSRNCSATKVNQRKKRYLDMTCTTEQVFRATGMCYGVPSYATTDQESARKQCTAENAGLYTPTSSAIQSFVSSSSILEGVSFDKYWIYITNNRWVDKVPVTSFTNYRISTSQNAAVVDMSNSNQWLHYDKDDDAGILCQKMVACPNPVYTMPDGSTVCWFMPWGENQARWDRAKDSCGRYSTDAFMIELDTEAKYKFLVNDWGVLDTLSGSWYWLNLNMDAAKQWQWSGQGVDSTWSNWDSANRQPDMSYNGTVADISNNNLWATLDEDDDTITAMVICEIRGVGYNGYFSSSIATTLTKTTRPDTTTQLITTPADPTTQIQAPVDDTTIHMSTIVADLTTHIHTTIADTTTQAPTTIAETTTHLTTYVPDITTPTEATTQVLATEETITVRQIPPHPRSRDGRPPLSEAFVLEESVIENLAILSEETKTAMGYSPYEFILDCQYEGWTCDVSHFYQINDPIFGNCYLFNSGWNSSVPVERSHRTGRRYGLSLVLNAVEDEYVANIGGASGVRVVVHHQHSMPHPDEDGLLAKPGEVTSIGVQKILYQRKGYPYGDCTSEQKNTKQDMYGDKYKKVHYSKKSCYRTCYQRHVIEKCGCADSYYPMKGKALRRSRSVLPCDTNNRIEDDCRYAVNLDYTRGKLGCHKKCPDACDEVYFDAEISTAVWPSSSHAPSILEKYESQIPSVVNSNDSSALWKNLLSVEIFYNDFSYEKIQEIETYKFGQFLSDFGGILGLWVGCSVISIFEFFELGLDLIVLGFCGVLSRCRSKQRNVSTSSDTIREQYSPDDNIKMPLRSVSSNYLRLHPGEKTEDTSKLQASPNWSSSRSTASSGFPDEFPATPSARRSRAKDMKKDNISRNPLRNNRRIGNVETSLPSSPSPQDLYQDEVVRTPRAVDVSYMPDIDSYASVDSGSAP